MSFIQNIKGLYGFRHNDKDYLSLNQMDSMFHGLGEHIFSFVHFLLDGTDEERTQKLTRLSNNLDSIKFVKVFSPISSKQREDLQIFHEECGLSAEENIKAFDWPSFFALEEGNIDMYFDGFPYMIDWSYMMLLSGEIHYAYIINLDNQTFEVYTGQNKTKIENSENRYSHLQHHTLHDKHFGVVLHKAIPFSDIQNQNKSLKDYL